MTDGGRTLCVRPEARASQEDDIPYFSRGEVDDFVEPGEVPARGLFILELGDGWVPEILASGRGGRRGREVLPNDYEDTYRALASEQWPADHHGARAQRDRYLELYGIVPTLTVLQQRLEAAWRSPCRTSIDLAALESFRGLDLDEDHHGEPGDGDESTEAALRVIQRRLACDGHYSGSPTGIPDDRTRAAIAEFERRHRIYARGSLSGPTLDALRTDALELERRAVVRALTERAMLDLGYIEDGSAVLGDGNPAWYRSATGERLTVRNLEDELARRIERSLGLRTVGGTRRFLAQVGDPGPRCPVAITAIEAPAYDTMSRLPLSVEIDRGDVWFDFPYADPEHPADQPIDRKPTLTLYTELGRRRVPLVRYGTTVGGWRIVRQNGADVWQYKESPTGRRAWSEVVSAPVWLPPTGVPPASLVLQTRLTGGGELVREINRGLVGPGYASAYGLVAAYHRTFAVAADGGAQLGDDEGIRTHGSGDYTSIWRRASLGCHRLHNHRALRLFSFILKHRRHRRIGHRPARYRVPVRVEGFSGEVRVDQTGHVYELETPIVVDVLPGRIRGTLRQPPTHTIPRESP